MAEITAYNEAFQSNLYQKHSGLLGKYDNVRRFWEDEELELHLKPYLEQLAARRKQRGEKLRLLDLGCGSGDGLELAVGTNGNKPLRAEHNTKILDPSTLGLYKGVDVNQELLNQARAIYGNRQNVAFVQSDLNDFDLGAEEPYDLYLANYGTLSHNNDEQTVELLSNIARHGKDGAVIIVDWLGRYSYEWQTLWTKDMEHNQWIDYTISYIHTNNGIEQTKLSHFPLRIVGRQEVLHIYHQVKKRVGASLTLRKLADRSSFIGRHMDTAQYNPHCQPLRRLVNSLFEPNICANLDELLILYVPKNGFAEVNDYYQRLADCWNYLVTYTKALLEKSEPTEGPPEMPPPLKRSLSAMKSVVRAATRIKTRNAQASLIEPQLGYCLRELEIGLQQGLGCGHGLVAIFEKVK